MLIIAALTIVIDVITCSKAKDDTEAQQQTGLFNK